MTCQLTVTCLHMYNTCGPSWVMTSLIFSVLPSACSQCVVAGVDVEVCNPGTGDCSCDEHVIGEFCDRCEDGYFNVTDGCPPCQCDPTGKWVYTSMILFPWLLCYLFVMCGVLNLLTLCTRLTSIKEHLRNVPPP